MKSTILFVVLQYIIGYIFTIVGMFLFLDESNSLSASMFYSMLGGFIGMIVGVALVGYFHLRLKHVVHKFILAMMFSVSGLLLFVLLYELTKKMLPKELDILLLFLPLSGAVFGFNFIAVTAKKRQASN